MKKVSLLKPLLLLFALIVGSSSAWAVEPDLTLDFTSAWTAGADNSDGEKVFTTVISETTYTISGKGSANFKFSSGYFIFGKKDAYIKLPKVSFDVEKIEVVGNSGASASVVHNIYVGDAEASTAVTGLNGTTSTFAIGSAYQAANTQYILKVTSAHNAQVTYIKYYKKSSVSVPVTGVTLDQPSLTIPVGESETLTATVAPAEATNKTVTWSSNKESVATVVNGVVTGVSEGTATITVTTEDGGKTATCDVTVTAAPTAVVALDFTSNTWGFPEGNANKTAGTNSYTANGYTITLFGPSGNGYYYDTDANNLLIGKKDATLTLPAFAFNVKRIKVYGADGASGSVTFNVFVGDDAVSTQVTSSKVTQTFDIAADKQAEGTVYVIKVTNGNNMRISKIEVFGTKKVTIASSGYSTLASGYALDFSTATPAGLEAYVASSVTASGVDLSAVTEAPASTGVILKGTAGTEYTIPFKASAAAVGTNKLHAAVTAYDCAANEVYILKDGLFHLVTGASTVPAGKAYLLASDVPSGARELTFNFGDETAIRSLTPTLSEGEGVWYDLSGRRVENPTKGIYIMNGKKVIFK